MKVQLWTFGKESKSYIKAGVNLYSDRLKHYCTFSSKVLSAGKSQGKKSPDILKKEEADLVYKMLTPDHMLFVLDEKGKTITSPGLAKLIEQQQLNSTKILVFLIGGAYGTADLLLKKAKGVLSLSALTFPHQIVRLIMAEQIYRAFTILHHEPYHHL